MRRRTVLSTGAALATAGLAGCSVTDMGSDDDVFTVGTYTSFVDAPSDSPGEWIKEEFESRHDVEFEWHTPDQELTYYVERHNDGSEVEPELYLGVRPQNLVQADEQLEGDLFTSTDESVLSNAEDIDDEFYFDPEERAIPTFHSHCGIVYDGRNVSEPETFDDLLSSEYEGDLAMSNPNSSTTGLLFFLWTVDHFGEDGYLEYWNDLMDNDARVLDEWGEVYTQFEEEEIPVVVSYTDDRVYASRDGNDLDKHQVATLHDQGYANMAGMARFADGTDDDLAHEFMDFILEPEVQSVIAERNVTGPVNEETELPEEIEEYMIEPEEVVFFDYDELEGNLSTWLEEWEREVAGGF
ncbi:thiamine ABC transporter substrate-binding protein [Natronorubrum daqingense]|uniref:Thiamine ABC transporter substrate-binding protein n=1 Tax=Natronorubrum daqingense TaxID=588898 RepID=A0A1N7C7Y2_9EURY|nr:thiamine ABC transporter substrate-binding protein [Natronorubrum daqingense]APX96783.1 thiamine ABC transporter substrate-binding protein [Natronorubrum daqingense]SIR59695.1 thiamine transport system substrate-binding protein [Natronorubrum daqingense]